MVNLAGRLEPLVSMVLYLCGEDEDIEEQGGASPGNPMQRRPKEEGRLFMSDSPFG